MNLSLFWKKDNYVGVSSGTQTLRNELLIHMKFIFYKTDTWWGCWFFLLFIVRILKKKKIWFFEFLKLYVSELLHTVLSETLLSTDSLSL